MLDLAAFALRAILTLSPILAPRETLPGWTETPAARLVRMASIADDAASVVTEACASRAESAARDGCERWSVAGLVGVAFHESGFQPDTDQGATCYRGGGHAERCDGGASVSLWQIRAGGEEGKRWGSDRRAAAREALRRMVRSQNACRSLGAPLSLSAYAGGRCVTDGDAALRSRQLWALIARAAATP